MRYRWVTQDDLRRIAESVLAAKERQERAAIVSRWRATYSPPGKPGPCKVCGTWEGMTEAHHLLPLADQAVLGMTSPNHRTVWLCRNHHALVHAVAEAKIVSRPWWVAPSEWATVGDFAELIIAMPSPEWMEELAAQAA